MSFQTLSDSFWLERELLGDLQYRLEVQELVLTAGRSSLLLRTTQDIEEAASAVRAAEVGRAALSEDVAVALKLAPDASLAEIAEAAPIPWNDLMAEHRDAFISLTQSIAQLSHRNQEALATAHQATQETLMSLQEMVEVYDPTGARTTHMSSDARLIDEEA